MPCRRESLYPLDWLAKALQDFKRVKARLNEGDLEDAAFHKQTDKLMKKIRNAMK